MCVSRVRVYRCALEQERRDEKCEDIMCALRRERFLDKKIKQKSHADKAEKRGKPRQTTDTRDFVTVFVPQGQKIKKAFKNLSLLSISLSLSLSLVSLSLSCLSRRLSRGRLSFACLLFVFFPREREREPGAPLHREGGVLFSREREPI